MALIIDVRVKPRSKQQMLKLDSADRLVCYLKSAPEKGRANAELISFFSKTLQIPQGDIAIVSGATARTKRVKIITSMNYSQILEKFSIEKQCSIFV